MPWIRELAQLPTPTIAMRMAFLLFIRYSAWILRPLGRGGNAAPCSDYWGGRMSTGNLWCEIDGIVRVYCLSGQRITGCSELLSVNPIGLVGTGAEPFEHAAHGQIVLQNPRQLNGAESEDRLRRQNCCSNQLQRKRAADQGPRQAAPHAHERHTCRSHPVRF